MSKKKYLYLFSEGNKDMREILGGKGANLAEMTNAGMPVPQGFTISTEAELRSFAAMVNEGRNFAGKTVKLANSIAMSGGLWVPAGSVDFTSGGDAGDRFFCRHL